MAESVPSDSRRGMFVRSFCLMSSDAKSILGTIYKVSLSGIYWETRGEGEVTYNEGSGGGSRHIF